MVERQGGFGVSPALRVSGLSGTKVSGPKSDLTRPYRDPPSTGRIDSASGPSSRKVPSLVLSVILPSLY